MDLGFSIGPFYGLDSIINILNALVAFLIAYQSHNVYRLINEKRYKYFSWAFLSIGLAFAAKIFANLSIFHTTTFEKANFIITITRELHSMQLINFFSLITYKTFLLTGLLIIFLIATKTNKKEDIILISYFGIITLLFSIYFSFVFYLSIIIILAILASYFYKNYHETKTSCSHKVFLAFLFILIGNVFDLFLGLHRIFYIIAEALVFTGFVILLINHTKVENDQKKKQARSRERPSGSPKKRQTR